MLSGWEAVGGRDRELLSRSIPTSKEDLSAVLEGTFPVSILNLTKRSIVIPGFLGQEASKINF